MDTSRSGLSALQLRVLDAFRGVEDTWLTGGAALAAFHTHHRRSKDLDLFTTRAERLEELSRRLEQWCASHAVAFEVQQRYPGFLRYRVWAGDEETLVDLVHDLAPQLVAVPDKPDEGGIRVDPIREIRANKLAALLGRAETKDLVDLYVLAKQGWAPLDGLDDASLKDGGLDPATLGWVLAELRVDLEGLLLVETVTKADLEAFRDDLVEALQERSWPGSAPRGSGEGSDSSV